MERSPRDHDDQSTRQAREGDVEMCVARIKFDSHGFRVVRPDVYGDRAHAVSGGQVSAQRCLHSDTVYT